MHQQAHKLKTKGKMHCYPSIPSSLFIVTSIILWTTAGGEKHPCSNKFQEYVIGKNLQHCHRLPTLKAELGWSHPLPGKSWQVVEVVLGAPLDEEKGWVAWGVNPGAKAEMEGTRAAIGIKDPSKGVSCHTYNVTHETRIGCQLKPMGLEEIKCLGFEYDEGTQYHVLRANLNLSSTEYNVSRLNIVWQMGFDVDGDEPKKHVATLMNVDSVETLDLYSEQSSDMAHFKIYLRKVHGVLNIIGWGTLLPVGVIIARFFRKFPFELKGRWYFAHVGCQSTGFFIGVVGWGIGMWLAQNSPRYKFYTHRVFAIFIFVFATLQILAIRLSPSERDNSRKVWNIYHHFLGYALLPMIFINIFEGIRILKPENMEKWRLAVIGILAALGTITLILECQTWRKFIDDKEKDNKSESSSAAPAKPREEDHPRGTQISLATSPRLE